MNEASVLPLARWARAEGLILRFIEYMDVGHSNGWRLDDVVPAAEILDADRRRDAAGAGLGRNYRGEVAGRYRFRDGSGEVGVIASVTAAVLRRLHARPPVRGGHALHVPVRGRGHGPQGPDARRRGPTPSWPTLIASIWSVRADRYSELRSAATEKLPKVEMFALGG